jgi:hypothetical protein
MRQGASTLGQLGTLQQQLGASDAAALNSIGVQQQQQGQQSLDLAYQDFQNQRDYPKEQLAYVSNLFGNSSGRVGSSQSTTTTQPAGSTLGQIGSAALGTYGLYKMLFGGGRKGGGPVRRRYASGGRIALGSAPFKLRGFQEGGTVDTFPEGPWTGNLTPAEYNAIRSDDIAAYRRMRQLRGAAVGPSQVTTPPNTLGQIAPPNTLGQIAPDPERPPPSVLTRPVGRPEELTRDTRSQLRRDIESSLGRLRPSAPLTQEQYEQATGEGAFGRPFQRAVDYAAAPADQYQRTYGPQADEPGFGMRGTAGTIPQAQSETFGPPEMYGPQEAYGPQRPQPVTAIRRPGQRSSGAGTLPTTVQEAASQDLPRPAFLPDMAQPGTPEASAATRTLNDAMRDNVDRGESILMTAAKWAQAASQPGATFMGSLGAGAEAGLTNLRQQRQAARDAERFSQQLDLQRQTLGETTRYHDIEAQRQAEDRASRERIAESSNRTHLDAARISAGAAGAGTSITINAIRDATRTLADPNASEQDRNAAREFLTAYRGSALASEGRLDVAAENAISTRLRAEFPAGREMDPEAYDRRRAEISAEIRAQTGRTDRSGGNTAPQAAPLSPAQRQRGVIYNTPLRGPQRWTGTGWVDP